ncbi:oncoprotein-induced transcript 3 protein-like [Rhopilema esculentum]|uniref:oncoprotein-induced transcript 3 protein-like n=1 Tax=Rhopilema esculentum TaxID=499914 RepID=UPI0031DE99CA
MMAKAEMQRSVLFHFCFMCLLIKKASSEATECKTYKEISDWRRSTANNLTNVNESICDQRILAGWYRFKSPAGGVMPTKCPPDKSCGSISPVWINGSLPADTEKVKIVTACGRYRDDCCHHPWRTKATKCKENNSTFYVFYLVRTVFCMAYCAGSEKPCEEGWTSPNGFTPECKPIATTKSPGTRPTTFSSTKTTMKPKSEHTGKKKKVIMTVIFVFACLFGLGVFFAIAYFCKKHRLAIKNSVGCATADNTAYSIFKQ